MSNTEQNEQAQPASTHVSGAAHKALAGMVRKWSGEPKMVLRLGETPLPELSPFALTNLDTNEMWVDPDYLILNPNRILSTVTPFRLRQEAVLTGTLLHESAHVRHSHWGKHETHPDGKAVTEPQVRLAHVMEEARIEALMACEAVRHGASGLEWTMRASAAHLLTDTVLSDDPDQQVMDVIRSWALRAGREIALQAVTSHSPAVWVHRFTNLLRDTLYEHFERQLDTHPVDPMAQTDTVVDTLVEMIRCTDDEGMTMFMLARNVLEILYPDTDQPPSPGAACAMGAGSASDQGQDGDESDAQDSGGVSEPSDTDEPGEGDSEGEPSAAQQALTAMEEAADEAADDLAQAQAGDPADQKDQAQQRGGLLGGVGNNQTSVGGWRHPSPEEREMAKRAEKFLRDLIAPTESSTATLSDSPSSTIDGAAYSAWKAGGQHHDPRFFVRTRREVKPSPPVQVAILVDISLSMGILQAPSALLSWALGNAAVDLRNFAGRGTQVESCLIHWGDSAHVIQHNGEALPGIREVDCNEGTQAMVGAFALVEKEMPGFFDSPSAGEDVNRLLVQFTDWEISRGMGDKAKHATMNAMSNGVRMLTVSPSALGGWYCAYPTRDDYTRTGLSGIERQHSLVYSQTNPDAVWSSALDLLQGRTPAPFAGF